MTAAAPPDAVGTGARGPFLPLLLLALAFVGWAAIQTTQLLTDRQSLATAAEQQAQQLAGARRLRTAADSLAAKTQALADRGNPDARLVVAKLKERGISIDANATATAPP